MMHAWHAWHAWQFWHAWHAWHATQMQPGRSHSITQQPRLRLHAVLPQHSDESGSGTWDLEIYGKIYSFRHFRLRFSLKPIYWQMYRKRENCYPPKTVLAEAVSYLVWRTVKCFVECYELAFECYPCVARRRQGESQTTGTCGLMFWCFGLNRMELPQYARWTHWSEILLEPWFLFSIIYGIILSIDYKICFKMVKTTN